ncbi:30S ribosomal protein S13 [Nanoarchaeota archaeon]|nr:MAG: 30S ribosomal protein S13 [Nanoarchaeota archaeon]
MAKKEVKVIRIRERDLHGDEVVVDALRKIKGISFMFSNAIVNALGIPKSKKIDELTDEEIKSIEDAILNPKKYGIPEWMFNWRKDLETGENLHITASDLTLKHKFHIKHLIAIKSYRGMRHAYGLKVRGQKTKAHPRRGRTVGVRRKKK